MSRFHRHSDAPKIDQYQAITDRMIAALEESLKPGGNKAPWLRPWKTTGGQRNGATGYVYKGINKVLTLIAGFCDPRWYTYNQVASGKFGESHVRKGEKGTHIVKWLPVTKTVMELDENGDEAEHHYKRMLLRTYVVFNHQQIEWAQGCEPQLPDAPPPVDPALRYGKAQAVVTASGASIQFGSDRACYIPSLDHIQMPAAAQFQTVEDFWATHLHELVHWTGHKARCNRTLDTRFGSDSYAMEELVAELGSAFLCTDLGIEGKLQHEAYILNWITRLQNDKYALFTASRMAQEAANWLLAAEDNGEAPEATEADNDNKDRNAQQVAA